MRYLLMVIYLMCLVGCGSDNEKKNTFKKADTNVEFSNAQQPQSVEQPKEFGAGTYENEVLKALEITEDDNIMDVFDKVMEQSK